jgi:hypothetical protein
MVEEQRADVSMGSATSTVMLRFRRSTGTMSGSGSSSQSTSPFCNAAAVVAWSAMMIGAAHLQGLNLYPQGAARSVHLLPLTAET